MNFDYRFGTEATFSDWVYEGVTKAQAMLNSVDNDNTTEDVSSGDDDK